jgi:hypothetical protein
MPRIFTFLHDGRFTKPGGYPLFRFIRPTISGFKMMPLLYILSTLYLSRSLNSQVPTKFTI